MLRSTKKNINIIEMIKNNFNFNSLQLLVFINHQYLKLKFNMKIFIVIV